MKEPEAEQNLHVDEERETQVEDIQAHRQRRIRGSERDREHIRPHDGDMRPTGPEGDTVVHRGDQRKNKPHVKEARSVITGPSRFVCSIIFATNKVCRDFAKGEPQAFVLDPLFAEYDYQASAHEQHGADQGKPPDHGRGPFRPGDPATGSDPFEKALRRVSLQNEPVGQEFKKFSLPLKGNSIKSNGFN